MIARAAGPARNETRPERPLARDRTAWAAARAGGSVCGETLGCSYLSIRRGKASCINDSLGFSAQSDTESPGRLAFRRVRCEAENFLLFLPVFWLFPESVHPGLTRIHPLALDPVAAGSRKPYGLALGPPPPES